MHLGHFGKKLPLHYHRPLFLHFHTILKRKKPRLVYCPLHHAGVFYSQEPSAASAVTVLNPKPGEIILDLCAAPGGKNLLKLQGYWTEKVFLWSNEIVKNRANVLLSNIERLGRAKRSGIFVSS